jgi:hypothetical protein
MDLTLCMRLSDDALQRMRIEGVRMSQMRIVRASYSENRDASMHSYVGR